MIEIRCFESFAQAAHLAAAAEALNRAAAVPDPFSTFAFLDHFERHDTALPPRAPGAAPATLWLLFALRDGEPVGYVALRRTLRRRLGRDVATLGFLATHDTDRPRLVAREADLAAVSAAVWAYLLQRHADWSVLELRQQDAGSALFPPPAGTDLSRHRVCAWPTLENGTVHVRWPTLGAYFAALPRKFRLNLGRQLRALQAAGRLELLSSANPRSTPALLDLYLAVETQSWKPDASAGIARSAERVDYVRGLLADAQPMRVSIHVLLLDDRPIAGLVNGAFAGGLYALHVVYDETQARLAPGSAMLLLGMREAIAGGHAFYNLMSGFRYYKAHWLAEITETQAGQVYRRGSLPDWLRRAGDARRWLSARTPQRPPQARFNPARRQAGARPHAAPLPIDPTRRDALVVMLRADPAVFVAASALSALLPVTPAEPPSPRPAARAARPA